MKKRIDRLLVERGLAETREKAQALIMAGLVLVDGQPAAKAGMPVADTVSIELKESGSPYVGRGGVKLEGAAKALGLDPAGWTCVDVGSSTGGFTQFLLMAGAVRVYAVDDDVKQLDWRVRQDTRVVPVEKNARFLEPADIGEYRHDRRLVHCSDDDSSANSRYPEARWPLHCSREASVRSRPGARWQGRDSQG